MPCSFSESVSSRSCSMPGWLELPWRSNWSSVEEGPQGGAGGVIREAKPLKLVGTVVLFCRAEVAPTREKMHGKVFKCTTIAPVKLLPWSATTLRQGRSHNAAGIFPASLRYRRRANWPACRVCRGDDAVSLLLLRIIASILQFPQQHVQPVCNNTKPAYSHRRCRSCTCVDDGCLQQGPTLTTGQTNACQKT